MSIRPIDFQVMIPKTVDVSRIQSNEQHGSLAAMQSKLQSVEKQSEQNMKQVSGHKEVSEIYIKENGERKNRGTKQDYNQDDRKGKEKNRCSKYYMKKTPGSKIDIRL